MLALNEQSELKGAEAQNRTEIACSSDRCLDQLGYLGKYKYILP
jgi:hypothetical protein